VARAAQRLVLNCASIDLPIPNPAWKSSLPTSA
jgi:hypothetical protein